jgi:hypothetical protein
MGLVQKSKHYPSPSKLFIRILLTIKAYSNSTDFALYCQRPAKAFGRTPKIQPTPPLLSEQMSQTQVDNYFSPGGDLKQRYLPDRIQSIHGVFDWFSNDFKDGKLHQEYKRLLSTSRDVNWVSSILLLPVGVRLHMTG